MLARCCARRGQVLLLLEASLQLIHLRLGEEHPAPGAVRLRGAIFLLTSPREPRPPMPLMFMPLAGPMKRETVSDKRTGSAGPAGPDHPCRLRPWGQPRLPPRRRPSHLGRLHPERPSRGDRRRPPRGRAVEGVYCRAPRLNPGYLLCLSALPIKAEWRKPSLFLSCPALRFVGLAGSKTGLTSGAGV